MIVGAFWPFEALELLAGKGLVHKGVKLLLLPAVAMLAALEALAPLLVAGDEGAALPVLAQLDLVSEEVRAPAEVLKVVCVHTLRLVVLMVERTPLRLEEEHVKVKVGRAIASPPVVRREARVGGHGVGWGGLALAERAYPRRARRQEQVVEEPHLDVLHAVREAAELAVLALRDLPGVKVAKLRLVLLAVVEPLDAVVRAFALVPLRALLRVGELAQLGRVDRVIPSPVLQRVVKVAGLVIVSDSDLGAFEALELRELQVPHDHVLACTVVLLDEAKEDEGGLACLLIGDTTS